MDSNEIDSYIRRCRLLRYKYAGTFASDELQPLEKLPNETFIIVNASPRLSVGTHWLLIILHNGTLTFADSLARPLAFYPDVAQFCLKQNKTVRLLRHPLQSTKSTICGHFAIYMAYLFFSNIQLHAVFNPTNTIVNELFCVRWFRKHFVTNNVQLVEYNF